MVEEKVTLVECLGMDMKLHTCDPASKTTVCGEPVRRKKLTMLDFSKFPSCYECTY